MTIDATGGEEQPDRLVHQDRTVTVNWLRFNIPSLVAVLVATVSITIYISTIATDVAVERSRLSNSENARTARDILVDNQLAEVKTTLKAFNDIPYKVSTNSAAIAAQQAALAATQDDLRKSLDSMRDTIRDLSIKVGVQSDKIENLSNQLSGRPQHSRFTLPNAKVQD
jgi:hypothetical protein